MAAGSALYGHPCRDAGLRPAPQDEGCCRLQLGIISACAPRIGARFAACNPSEHCSGHQPGAARIVEVKKSADQLASGIKAGDWRVLDIEDMGRWVDLHA